MITTPDSPEISFHRKSVQNADIDALAVGTPITCNEIEGLGGVHAIADTWHLGE
jgi:hypothetical protein